MNNASKKDVLFIKIGSGLVEQELRKIKGSELLWQNKIFMITNIFSVDIKSYAITKLARVYYLRCLHFFLAAGFFIGKSEEIIKLVKVA